MTYVEINKAHEMLICAKRLRDYCSSRDCNSNCPFYFSDRCGSHCRLRGETPLIGQQYKIDESFYGNIPPELWELPDRVYGIKEEMLAVDENNNIMNGYLGE